MKTMTVKNYIAYLLLYYYYYTTVCYKSEDRLYDDSFWIIVVSHNSTI